MGVQVLLAASARAPPFFSRAPNALRPKAQRSNNDLVAALVQLLGGPWFCMLSRLPHTRVCCCYVGCRALCVDLPSALTYLDRFWQSRRRRSDDENGIL